MADTMPEMSASFVKLHDCVFLENDAKREQRWQAVIAISAKADIDTIEVLTRLAFATPAPATGRKDSELAKQFGMVVAEIGRVDPTFEAGRDRRELQLAAAAALLQLLPLDADAGLAITLASFGGRRPDLPIDLAGMAEEGLGAMSRANHHRGSHVKSKITAPEIEYEIEETALAAVSGTEIKAELEALQEAVDLAFKTMASRYNVSLASMQNRMAAADEELQMLWWLTNGVSQSRNSPFRKLGTSEKPLILAGELAEMTDRSPGPVSVSALLARAGVDPKKVSVAAAVNEVPSSWAASMSDVKRISPVTSPIHLALEKRVETGSTDAWQSSWSAMTGLQQDLAMTADQLGLAFYRERLLLTLEA